MYKLLAIVLSFSFVFGCFENKAQAAEQSAESPHYDFIGQTIKDKKALVRYLDLLFYISFNEVKSYTDMTLSNQPLDFTKTNESIAKYSDEIVSGLYYWTMMHVRILNLYEHSIKNGDVSVFPGGLYFQAEDANIRYKIAQVSVVLHNSLYKRTSGSMDLLNKGSVLNMKQDVQDILEMQKQLTFSKNHLLVFYDTYWVDLARKASFTKPQEISIEHAFEQIKKLNIEESARYLMFLLSEDLAAATLKIVIERKDPADKELIKQIVGLRKTLREELTNPRRISHLNLDIEFCSPYINF